MAATAGSASAVSVARFLVRGHVQGVGFRWYVLSQARSLRVTGYARNLPDGSVEVVAQAGDSAALDRLHALLARGPDGAVVQSVERQDSPDDAPATMRSFDIR